MARKGFKKGVCNVFCQTMKASAGVCTKTQRKAALRAVKTGMTPGQAVTAKCGGGGVHGLAGSSRGQYEVIVGNVGNVYYGGSKAAATKAFNEYVRQSKANRGRAGGESVTMMQDGEPIREHGGSEDASW